MAQTALLLLLSSASLQPSNPPHPFLSHHLTSPQPQISSLLFLQACCLPAPAPVSSDSYVHCPGLSKPSNANLLRWFKLSGMSKNNKMYLSLFGFVFNVQNRESMFFWFDIRVTVPGVDHFWYFWFLPVRYAMLLPSCHRLCPHQVLFLRVPPLNVLVRFFVKKGGKGL